MKSFFLLIAFFALTLTVFSQDVITQKSGDDILAKILEIDQNEIKYKRFENLEGPTYTLGKSSILMIRYENGTKDIFDQIEQKKTTTDEPKEDMRMKGMLDAQQNYHGAWSGKGLTFWTVTLLSPVSGLIPAGACSSVPPSDKNLNYPDPELMKDADYNIAYKNEAHKIKKRKVWGTYGGASIGWIIGALLLL